MDEEKDSFNFWPSFTDIMIILIIIITLVLFLLPILQYLQGIKQITPTTPTTETSVELINPGPYLSLKQIEEKQMATINSLVSEYNTGYLENPINIFNISSANNSIYDIKIINYPTEQKIMFSDMILFKKGESSLNKTGENALFILGKLINNQIINIQEIQIQGHADTDRPNSDNKNDFNLKIASDRAITVFIYLRDISKIKPEEHLMSVTSFGQYVPIDRSLNIESDYNEKKIEEQNISEALKTANRRIEIIMKYKYKKEEIK